MRSFLRSITSKRVAATAVVLALGACFTLGCSNNSPSQKQQQAGGFGTDPITKPVKDVWDQHLISRPIKEAWDQHLISGSIKKAMTPPPKPMTHITSEPYGKTRDGKTVMVYSLYNHRGAIARIITWGATLTELHMPDREGVYGDVVLGFDKLHDYETRSPFFGATTGRVANRIAGGEFTLDGETYQLAINNGPNTLHGGKVGFDKKVWDAKIVANNADGPSVAFHTVSPDMDENFPGAMDVTVTYTLTEDNAIRIAYKATTDKPTIVNLTNHSYFNLSAFKSPTILDEVMELNCDHYTPVDANLIPTGKIRPVRGTPFDFFAPTKIGERIASVPGGPPTGYDINYVINPPCGRVSLAGKVTDQDSGRSMEVWTSEPGVQFYTGNFLDGSLIGKGGVQYVQHSGFCLETQHYPDSIHQPEFPSTVLRPGQTFSSTTIYKFSVR